MNQHIHHLEIKAWADGAMIEYFDDVSRMQWLPCLHNEPAWLATTKYRVKPQPDRVRYKQFLWRPHERLCVDCVYEDGPKNSSKPEELDGFIRWLDDDWQEEIV